MLGSASYSGADARGWVVYSGSFVNTITSGATNIGFEATSGTSYGNFLDTVDVVLAPFMQFERPAFSTREGAAIDAPSIEVAGRLLQDKRIYFQVVPGTSGLDDITYDSAIATSVAETTDTYFIKIDAGDHTGGAAFDLGLRGTVDGVTEGNEVLTIRLLDSPDSDPAYLIENTQICGGVVQREISWTLRDATPALELSKTGILVDANLNGVPDAGDTVSYSFTVRNTGSETLANVVIVDPSIGSLPVFAVGNLPVDASANVVVSGVAVTHVHVIAGQIANTAYATGLANGSPVRAPDATASIPLVARASIELTKIGRHDDPAAGTARIGHKVYYTFRITNTGNVRLADIRLQDARIGLDQVFPGPLLPGAPPMEIVTSTAEAYSLVQSDLNAGQVLNTAMVSAVPADGSAVVTDSDSVTVTLLTQTGLRIDKSAVRPADGLRNVPYTFVITNIGSVQLQDVAISDSMIRTGISCGPTAYPVPLLNPGQPITCTAQYVLSDADLALPLIVNEARAAGATLSGIPVISAMDSVSFAPPAREGLTIRKVADTINAPAPKRVTYVIEVANTGTMAFDAAEVLVTDIRLGASVLRETTGVADNELGGVDILLQEGESRSLLLEYATSRGPGFGSRFSLNGGLDLKPATPNHGLPGQRADAWRIAGRTDLGFLGLAGEVEGFLDRKQAGFTSPDDNIEPDQQAWGLAGRVALGAPMPRCA